MGNLFAFLANTFREGTPESFGRVYALPFLLSACTLSTVSGAMAIHQGVPVTDDVASLALIGLTLFTGSKYLSMKGKTIRLVEKTAEAAPPAT